MDVAWDLLLNNLSEVLPSAQPHFRGDNTEVHSGWDTYLAGTGTQTQACIALMPIPQTTGFPASYHRAMTFPYEVLMLSGSRIWGGLSWHNR